MIERFCHIVDLINDRVGNGVAWISIPLMFIVTLEVILRYVFNRPTIWAWDVNTQLACLLVIFAGGYALLVDAHVKVDILVMRLSLRKKAILNLITSVLFFLGVGGLVWQGWVRGMWSVSIREILTTIWEPPIYPLKMCIPVAAFLLLLQGVAKFMRDLAIVRSGGGQS